MITCMNCKTPNTEGSIICDSCHEPLISLQNAATKTCQTCGVEILPGNNCCTNCGSQANPDANIIPAPPEKLIKRSLSLEDGTIIATIAVGNSKILGRNSEESDIPLSGLPDADCVSRKHARILAEETGFEVEDLRSTNNTFVDGKIISPGTPAKAGLGAKISLAGRINLIVS